MFDNVMMEICEAEHDVLNLLATGSFPRYLKRLQQFADELDHKHCVVNVQGVPNVPITNAKVPSPQPYSSSNVMFPSSKKLRKHARSASRDTTLARHGAILKRSSPNDMVLQQRIQEHAESLTSPQSNRMKKKPSPMKSTLPSPSSAMRKQTTMMRIEDNGSGVGFDVVDDDDGRYRNHNNGVIMMMEPQPFPSPPPSHRDGDGDNVVLPSNVLSVPVVSYSQQRRDDGFATTTTSSSSAATNRASIAAYYAETPPVKRGIRFFSGRAGNR